MSPTPDAAPTFYQTRHTHLTIQAGALAQRARWLRIALFVMVAITLLAVVGYLRDAAPAWSMLVSFAIAAFVVSRLFRVRRQRDPLLRLLSLYDQAMARIDGSQPQSGRTGEAFRSPAHLYDRDLAILGPDSLFGLLATVRTGVGERGLAHDLLHPPTREQTLERQQAIQELTPRNDLREQIHLLGVNNFQQVPAAFFDTWLHPDPPPPTFHPAVRYALLLTSILLIGLLITGLWHLAPWATLNPILLAVFILQSAIGLYLRPRVLPVLNDAANLSNQMQMFQDGLALLQTAPFTSPRLLALQHRSLKPDNAVLLIKKIQSQFVIVEQRTKQWFLIASLLTNAGTHAAISIANWKRRYADPMKHWLAVWGEFESLSALATYAYEHPGNIYPEILPTGTSTFQATALAHPLLPATAVPNDIALKATGSESAASLYLISGSNMAGKSTLLRAIGLNAVLAAAGAPIRATSARISPLAIGASLALTDSLAEGKSKFLAEVERLHAILQLSHASLPVLFLIDEIFSGTNSLDRRLAAEAVARSLVARNAIGALSTHDLTLTEMAVNPALRAVNLHMASPNPAEPLAFDYRLKPGINRTSNALAILRLIGIDIPA